MRSIQEILSALVAIVQHNRKAAGRGDDEFFRGAVCVAASGCACGHVIEVVGAPDGKGNVAIALNEGQITAMIGNLWQIDDPSRCRFHRTQVRSCPDWNRSSVRRRHVTSMVIV